MIEKVRKFIDKYQACIFIFFVLIFWLIRIPLFDLENGWDGEDGNGLNTHIFVNQPSAPYYSLYARIDGKEISAPPFGHPGLPYELFSTLGEIFSLVFPLESFSDQQIVLLIKLIVNMTQFGIYLLLGIQLIQNVRKPIKKMFLSIFLFVLSCAPISLYSSSEFQIDSFWGVLMVALFLLSFINYFKRRKTFPAILLFLASLFLGFGKNEWSLMLFMSSVFILLLYIFVSKLYYKTKLDRQFLVAILVVIVGNLIGNIINYAFEPELYMSGLHLIIKMVTTGSMSSEPSNVAWFKVFLDRIPFISTNIFLIFIISSYIFQERKRINFYYLFLAVFSFSLFFSFFISSWGNYSRYFAPSFIALSYVFLLYFVNKRIKLIQMIGIVLMFFLIGFYSNQLLGKLYEISQNSVYYDIETNTSSECLPLVDVGRVYRKKNVDFFHISYGYKDAQDIAKNYDKNICKF